MVSVVPLPSLTSFWGLWRLGSVCSTVRRKKELHALCQQQEKGDSLGTPPPASLGPLALYNGAITADFLFAGAMPNSHARHTTLSSNWAISMPAFRRWFPSGHLPAPHGCAKP
eukprot:366558-Chlamydomonas_euryale.AAC.13